MLANHTQTSVLGMEPVLSSYSRTACEFPSKQYTEYDIIVQVCGGIRKPLGFARPGLAGSNALPRKVHPKEEQHRKIVLKETWYPRSDSSYWSLLAVVLSSFHICSSTIILMVSVTFWGFPEPAPLATAPVSRSFTSSLYTPT